MNNPANKRKLIVILGILLGLGFALTSFISYFVSRDSIRESIINNELPLTSDNIYSEIQKDLVRPIFISSMMSSDTFLRDWVLDGEKDITQLSKYLKEVKTRYNAFSSFFVSDHTQNYYYDNGILKQVKKDEPRDTWYFRVREMQSPYEINVDPDLANRDALTIFINFRVYDYGHNFIGATGIGLTVDAVRKLIIEYQNRYKRDIYFVDANGNIVVFGNSSDSSGKNIRNMEGLSKIADKLMLQDSASFQYQKSEKTMLLNVRYIPELHWYLFVEKFEDEALEEIRNTLYMNLAISLGISVVVLMLTNFTINFYQKRLEEMASVDKLTGLANRQVFEFYAEQALSETKRTKVPMSAMLIDIDSFKSINDRFGHYAGDAVIQGIAEIAKANMRESDLLCRWGGDEYLVLLKNCNLQNAEALAEKIRASVRKSQFNFVDIQIAATISIGIAEYQADESIDHLFMRADNALYTAKTSGRNKISIA